MPRIVEDTAVIDALVAFQPNWSREVLQSVINRIPTADADPVVRGHWEKKKRELSPGFFEESLVCSVCDAEYDLTLMRVCCTDVLIFPICPCCGARIDKEVDE